MTGIFHSLTCERTHSSWHEFLWLQIIKLCSESTYSSHLVAICGHGQNSDFGFFDFKKIQSIIGLIARTDMSTDSLSQSKRVRGYRKSVNLLYSSWRAQLVKERCYVASSLIEIVSTTGGVSLVKRRRKREADRKKSWGVDTMKTIGFSTFDIKYWGFH